MAIYKPQTRKGPVFLDPENKGPPTITLQNGQVITAVPANQRGGLFYNEGNYQYVFPNDVLGQQGATLTYGGKTQVLGNTNMSYRGDIGSLQESSKGAIGDPSGMGGFAPGQIGSSFYPANMLGAFPGAAFGTFDPIKAAKYKPTDILKFATDFGEFNRGEMKKNQGMSKDIALDSLNTELQGLQTYAPAASALKRSETNLDNVFNQSQRERQVEQGLPGAKEDLLGQRDRANAFASGGLPSGLDSNGLEVGIRSRAADNASAGGFGARSSVARKASELMSTESKIGLSQYGDQLLSSNVNQRANLFLAPTEYSNAGGQINVNPSFSAGQAQLQTFSNLNSNTTLSPATALSADINQKQFVTSLHQQTNTFNATGAAQMSLANANIANTFALDKFQYQVGFAGAVAGAAQTDANTQLQLKQQKDYQEAVANGQAQVQNSQQTQAVGQAVGAVITGAGTILNSMNSGQNGSGAATGGSSGGSTGGGSNGTPVTGSGADTQPGTVPDHFSIDPGNGSGGSSDGGFRSDTDVTPPGGFLQYPGNGDTGGGFSGATSDGGSGSSGDSLSGGGGGEAGGGYGGGVEYASLRSYNKDLSQDLPTTGPQARSLDRQSLAVLGSAGLSDKPAPGWTDVGVDNSGKPVYSNTQLLKSDSTTTGTNMVGGLNHILEPFTSLSDKDKQGLDELAGKAGDPEFIKKLDGFSENNDFKGYVNTVVDYLGNKQNQKDLAGTTVAAYQVAQNWGRMSPAQKSLAVASLGIQAFKTSDGKNLGEKEIIPKTASSPGLTVAQGLDLFKAGINTYSLVKNWDQVNAIGKVAGGTQNVKQMADLAKSYNLLGYGVSGASVPNVKEEELTKAGYSSSPSLGIGALSGKTGSTIPPGYSLVSKSGDTQVVAPTANVSSTTPNQTGSLLGTAGGSSGVSNTTKNVYQSWAAGGKTEGTANGASGGSAMAAGLAKMKETNPYILGSVVAGSLMGGTAPFNGQGIPQGPQNYKVTDDTHKQAQNPGVSDAVSGFNGVERADGKTAKGGVQYQTDGKFNPSDKMQPFQQGQNKGTTDAQGNVQYSGQTQNAKSLQGNAPQTPAQQEQAKQYDEYRKNQSKQPPGPTTTEQTVKNVIDFTRVLVNTGAKLGSKDAKDAGPFVSLATAGENLYTVFNNPNSTDKQKAEAVAQAAQAGVTVGTALGSTTASSAAPYVNEAMAAYNASKILRSDMTKEEKDAAIQRSAENTAASINTFGLSNVAMYADSKLLGGKGEKLREKADDNLNKPQPSGVGATDVQAAVSGDSTGEQKVNTVQKAEGSGNTGSSTTGGDSTSTSTTVGAIAGKKGGLVGEAVAFWQNPYGYVAGKVIGLGLDKTSGGKSGDQKGRDDVRSIFQLRGLADGNYKITLADGTQASVGKDGHGAPHQVADPSKLTKDQADVRTLNAWDADYTNDLDYTSGTVGIALSRMLTGEKGTNVDQVGGQLGNAMLGNIGLGKEFNEQNFSKLTANMRAVYAQSGIKSKADAYQLINQGFAEGRWTDSDVVSMHMATDLAFDKNGYDTASKLMAGRFGGIETAGGKASASSDGTSKIDAQHIKPLPEKLPRTPGLSTPPSGSVGSGPQAGQVNYSPSQSKTNTPSGPAKDPGYDTQNRQSLTPMKIDPGSGDRGGYDFKNMPKKALMSRSKDEVKAKNRQRYSQTA